jgi:hypothetical protein
MIYRYVRTSVLLLLLLLYQITTVAQVINKQNKLLLKTKGKAATSDSSAISRAIKNREILINPALIKIFTRPIHTDTVQMEEAEAMLEMKRACECEKYVDTAGCMMVHYADGLSKRICSGSLVEVITADGKRHIVRQPPRMMMGVVKLRPPENPSTSDVSYQWLKVYSEELFGDVQALLQKNNKAIADFLSREKRSCENNVYRQVVYRTTFIEEFLKAR